MRTLSLDAIYSSPLLGTLQKAKIIKGDREFSIIEDDRLKERINWGDIPDQPFAEFAALWNKTSYDREFVPPAGDSSVEKGKKITELIMEIQKKYLRGRFVLVSHGGAICDFLFNNFSLAELAKYNSLVPDKRSDAIKVCSITAVSFNGHEFNVNSVASRSHLGE